MTEIVLHPQVCLNDFDVVILKHANIGDNLLVVLASGNQVSTLPFARQKKRCR